MLETEQKLQSRGEGGQGFAQFACQYDRIFSRICCGPNGVWVCGKQVVDTLCSSSSSSGSSSYFGEHSARLATATAPAMSSPSQTPSGNAAPGKPPASIASNRMASPPAYLSFRLGPGVLVSPKTQWPDIFQTGFQVECQMHSYVPSQRYAAR